SVSGRLVLPDGYSPQQRTRGGELQSYELRPFYFFPRNDIRERRSRPYSLRVGTATDQFQFSGILPGSYDLIVQLRDGLYGRAAIDVVNKDVEGVVLEVTPNVTL